MGSVINSLAELPEENGVQFFIFTLHNGWIEPKSNFMIENFLSIAARLQNSLVVSGTNPQHLTAQVTRKYLEDTFLLNVDNLLPAYLITDAHPDHINNDSLRLMASLHHAEGFPGGLSQFLTCMIEFVERRDYRFAELLQPVGRERDDLVSLRPGMFGISINLNEAIKRLFD